MRASLWTVAILGLACHLPACGPNSVGGGSLFGSATGGDFDFNFCPSPVECESAEYGLFAHRGRLALEVGESLEVRLFINVLCPDLCLEDVSSVEWHASWPDIVRLTPEETLSVVVTGLAPGEIAITADITFVSGASRRIERFLDDPGPLVVTVVLAES